jgi:hypothetical protein
VFLRLRFSDGKRDGWTLAGSSKIYHHSGGSGGEKDGLDCTRKDQEI